MSLDLTALARVGTPLKTARRQLNYVILHMDGRGHTEKWTPSLVNTGLTALVAWEDASDWIVDMLGEHQNNAGTLNRFNPEPHPLYGPDDGQGGQFCIGLELLNGIGALANDPDVSGVTSYDGAIYHCTYSPLTYDLGSDADAVRNGEISRYVTRDLKDVGENMTITGGMNWTIQNVPGQDDPIGTPPTIPATYSEMMYWHENVPDPITNLRTRALGFYGTVNTVAFDTLYSVGTVLYLGISSLERIPQSPAGNKLWRIGHKLTFRAQGWNVAYRANRLGMTGNNNGWEAIMNTKTRLPIFPNGGDFGTLFNL